jgi:hypothetical protein
MPTILPLQAYETLPLQAAMRNLWLGQTIKEAIDGRRIHHQLAPMHVSYEPDFSQVNKECKSKLNKGPMSLSMFKASFCQLRAGSLETFLSDVSRDLT